MIEKLEEPFILTAAYIDKKWAFLFNAEFTVYNTNMKYHHLQKRAQNDVRMK